MKKFTAALLYSLMGIALFFLMYLVINTELTYHNLQLGFSTSGVYFNELAAYPGGLLTYFSLFVFQFSNSPFWGAIVHTLIVIALVVGFKLLLGNKKSFPTLFLYFIPVIFSVLLITNHQVHPNYYVAPLVLIWATLLSRSIQKLETQLFLKLAVYFLFFALSYYFLGGFLFLILCINSLLINILSKQLRNWALIIFTLFVALIIPLIAPSFFFITPRDAFLRHIPYFFKYNPGFILYGAYFSVAVVIIIHFALAKIFPKLDNTERTINNLSSQTIQLISLAAILIALVFAARDKNLHYKLNIDLLAHNKQWDKVLQIAKKGGCDDRIVQFQVNRALYHKGELPDKIFEYPQYWGVDALFLTSFFSNDMLLPTTELFFDLSYINEAIHYGNEAVSQNEFSPQFIEQLILATITSGKSNWASVYINELKTFPTFRKKALMYEAYVKGNPNPTLDAIIKPKKAFMPFTDFVVARKAPNKDLLNLLIDRPENKMVYEYLMAYYLLNNDIAAFVKHYSKGKNFAYESIPKSYQEALLLYSYELMRKGKESPRINFNKEILAQFNDYLDIIKNNGGSLKNAYAALKNKYGNTYWFYIHFNSPMTTKKNIEEN